MSTAGNGISERRERVTDFASLRVGMVVIGTDCGQCGGEHRGILAASGDEPGFGPHFVKRPVPSCRPHWTEVIAINADTVARGTVFRVVDDLESPALHEADLRHEQERADILAGWRPVRERLALGRRP